MPTPIRNRLPDLIPALEGFEGVVNTVWSKNFGYGALTLGSNVEVTDAKKLVRRDGYQRVRSGAYAGLYGSIDQAVLLAIHAGDLVRVAPDGSETIIATGFDDGFYSWSEDPAANIYFTCNRKSSGLSGSSGIVRNDGAFLPLVLAVPTILGVAAIDTAPWTVTPFNLGKKYDQNAVHLFATYLYPDGRESAPSESISLQVAPEISLLQVTVPPILGCTTSIYATTPGGSRYFLVANSTVTTFTFSTYFLQLLNTGEDYPYTTVLDSFPAEASLLAFSAGKLYAACYDGDARYGVVYCSLPLQYHLFNRGADFVPVAGVPLLLLPCAAGLIIGTDSNVYLWDEAKLQDLADYGVPPGICGDVDMEGNAFFWTLRGVAKAMPYKLVTEDRISVDPGIFNHAKIFYDRGYAKLVASTVSGNPVWNQWRTR